jgi:hypothetical protein
MKQFATQAGIHLPDSMVPPPPVCAECGRTMRLVMSEPHVRFSCLDLQTFECQCSATLQCSAARVE